MRRSWTAGLVVLVLAGCTSGPTAPAPTDAAPSPTPVVTPTPADPQVEFWLALMDRTPGGLDATRRDELVQAGVDVCADLGTDDLLMDGTVAAWSAWVDGDPELAMIFWQEAVDTMCPDADGAFDTVRELKDTFNP